MTKLGSTSETTNEDIMFTIKDGTLSSNPIIAIFNNEHSHCNITPSCPKLSNEGAGGSLVVCDDGIPACEKIAFKSPLKPMTLTHPKLLDNDLDIERTTKIPTRATLKSSNADEEEQRCSPTSAQHILGKAICKLWNVIFFIPLFFVGVG
jgi:hypothetical protein